METATKDIDEFLNFIQEKHFHDIIETSLASVLGLITPVNLDKSELAIMATSSLNELFSAAKNNFPLITPNQKNKKTEAHTATLYFATLIEMYQKESILNYIAAYVQNSDDALIIRNDIEDFYNSRQIQDTQQFYNYFVESESKLNKKEEEIAYIKQDSEHFAYAASHDLQEPLRMITSYLELLAAKYKNVLDPKANEFINFALDGSIRMKNLISGLLEFSRLNNTSTFKTINTNAVITSVINNLSSQIKDTNAVIIYKDLPEISGDAILIGKLFQHLISNAIKFRSTTPPHITITAEKQDDGYRFAVKDNGIGIQKEYTDKIFLIFHRLHAKHVYPGAGIGLAVCKKIVEKYNGKIWVDSAPNKGSTFYFTIN